VLLLPLTEQSGYDVGIQSAQDVVEGVVAWHAVKFGAALGWQPYLAAYSLGDAAHDAHDVVEVGTAAQLGHGYEGEHAAEFEQVAGGAGVGYLLEDLAQ